MLACLGLCLYRLSRPIRCIHCCNLVWNYYVRWHSLRYHLKYRKQLLHRGESTAIIASITCIPIVQNYYYFFKIQNGNIFLNIEISQFIKQFQIISIIISFMAYTNNVFCAYASNISLSQQFDIWLDSLSESSVEASVPK